MNNTRRLTKRQRKSLRKTPSAAVQHSLDNGKQYVLLSGDRKIEPGIPFVRA